MKTKEIKRLGMNPKDEKTERVLNTILIIPSVASPLLCLPDLHRKEKTEAPCSFVAATTGTIIPELTAPSVGCGMGVIVTSLTKNDLTPESLETFYQEMRQHLGARYGFLKNLLLWLGIIQRPLNRYDFTRGELADAVQHGAAAAIKKYALPPETLNSIEYNGNAMDEATQRALPPTSLLPRSAWVSGRHDIGYGFKGNHFLEVQYVDEIKNEEVAKRWSLEKDRVVVMYHGGGGAVSHYLGRYFAKRKKDEKLQTRALTFFAKVFFHFSSREGVAHARERWRYYFHPKQFQEIPLDTYEGRRALASIQASLNYSYAFRLAIIKRIQDALTHTFGKKAYACLLWDTIHNSIRVERVGDKEHVVHRHTATRVFPGKPVLISGFNTTCSYIGIGTEKGESCFFSADHGAGETIKQFEKEGKSRPHPQSTSTDIYTTHSPYKKTILHRTDEGLETVVKPLEEAGVTEPVALTRPIAVFKG